MSTVDWQRVRPLIERLCELPEAQHERFLESACDGDTGLLRTVRRLWAEERDDAGFLGLPFDEESLAARRVGPGAAIGSYRLVRELGRGGMGSVWLAEREGEFRQQVALKLVRLGMDTEDVVRRFRRERQLLADLDHPGIVRLYDGGRTTDGRPYLVLELVDGTPIDRHCEARGLDVDARLELFARVAEAVAAAHEHGVVHRDLKPSNVLVTTDGEPKVLDFGIAKVLGDEGPEPALLTRTGDRLLTPRYAAPEQVRGEPCTSATDVYALGVLLYELLCGRPPYELETASVREIETAVCEETPARPSRIVDTTRRRRLAGDLDVIVLRALAKEPERRYRDAGRLARDVRRHLAHEPIHARPDTTGYRVGKFVRRNRVLVAAAGLVAAILIASLIVSLILWRGAVEAERESRRTAYSARLQAAEAAIRGGRVASARSLLESTPKELRGWEWRHLASRLDKSLARLPSSPEGSHGYAYDTLAVSPDGLHVVLFGGSHLDLRHLRSGALVRRRLDFTFPHPPGASAKHVLHTARFDPSGRTIAVACPDGVRILSTADLSTERTLAIGTDLVNAAIFDPSGRYLACSLETGEIVVLGLPDYDEVARWRAHDPGQLTLAFDPAGERLASASWDQRAKVWAVPTFELEADLEGHEQWITAVAFSADGRLVTASLDGTARVWSLDRPGQRPLVFRDHIGPLHSLVTLPDGTVISGDESGTILRWRCADGATVAALRGHTGQVQALALDLVHDRLVSATGRDEVLVWSLDTTDVIERRGCEYQKRLRIRADGREVAIAAPSGRVHRWSLPDAQPLEPLVGSDEALGWIVDMSAERIVAHGASHLHAWTLGPTPRYAPLRRSYPSLVSDLVVAPPGRDSMVMLDSGVQAVALDGPSPAPIGYPVDGWRRTATRAGAFRTDDFVAVGPNGSVWALLPDESWRLAFESELDPHAVFSQGTMTLLLDARAASLWHDDELQWRSDDLGDSVASAAFHPREARLALGTNKGSILLLDRSSGRVLCELHGHTAATKDLAFTPAGDMLVSCSQDGAVRFWSTADSLDAR